MTFAVAFAFLLSPCSTQIAGHTEQIDVSIVDEPFGGALNWTEDARHTYQADYSVQPEIALDGENVHVVWKDYRYRSHYVYAIPPYDSPGTVTYSINALDFAGNFNSTPPYSFDITAQDTIPPEIEHESFGRRIAGYETVIEAIVRDNSQVEAVMLNFTDVSGSRFNVSMDSLEDDYRYYNTYRAMISPQMEEGNITYFIWTRDVNGNANMTDDYGISVRFQDSSPPVIVHSPPGTILCESEVYIEVEILDDAAVGMAELDYIDVNGEAHNVTMVPRGNDTYSYGIPPQPHVGTINYSIRAADINGNENSNCSYSVQIATVDVELPRIVHVPIRSSVVGYWIPIHAFVYDSFGLNTANLSIDGNEIMLGLLSTDGVAKIYYKRSTDGGKTWDDGLGNVGVDRPLTRWGSVDRPRIAVENDSIHIVFGESDPHGIFYVSSKDNGRTWSSPRMLADEGDYDIATHGDLVVLVWTNYSRGWGHDRLHYAFSTDGGSSWFYGGVLNETLFAETPRMALDGRYLHVLVNRPDSRFLYYMRGRWNGSGFSWDDGMGNEREARIVGENGLSVTWPPQAYEITARRGKVHMAYTKEIYHTTNKLWCDGFSYDFYTPYVQLVYNGSLDDGSYWSTGIPTVLVDSKVPVDEHSCAPLYMWDIRGHNIRDVDLAFDGSTVHIAWSDSRDDNSTYEIYYKTGDAEGKIWSNDTRLTFNETYHSSGVTIAVWGDVVHLSWQDTRDQWWDRWLWWSSRHPEIYYKRMPVFPSIRPPKAVSAGLEGSAQENVNVTWSRSPDDIVGPNPVLQYELYYSTYYNRAGSGYQLLTIINANGSDAYHYVHQGAGNGDPNSYFYRVIAVGVDGLPAPCLTQVAKYTRWLTSGMQLVSIPLELKENRIDDVFQTLNYSSIWHYDSTDRTWDSCHSAKPYCFFPPVDRSMAYWVNVSQDGYMTVAGVVPSITWVSLEQGWNLIGYPSFLNDSSADVFAGLKVSRSETYEGASLPFNLRLLSVTGEMKAGEGYWVYSQVSQRLFLSN